MAAWLLAALLPSVASAGGDPRQVLVVANGDDADSVAIAEHYAVSRGLPDGHICELTGVSAATTELDFATYDSLVPAALDACLAALPSPDDIHILVTTRGLPYRVTLGAGYTVGFESLLQVHRSIATSDGSPLAGSPQTDVGGYFAASVANPTFVGSGTSVRLCDFSLSNDYAPWYNAACPLLEYGNYPAAFDRHGAWSSGPWAMADNLFIVTRLDGFDAEDAMDLVDRGVSADQTFPTAPLMGMKSADSARGARDPECEQVVRYLDLAGLSSEWVDTFDGALSGHTVAGYLTGAASMTGAIAGNTYVDGALTDNLTSYGAVPNNFFCDETGETCPASESQTSVARFVRAGATGAHGTVAEPLNNVFPNSTVYLLYTAGYSLGESYLFSQRYVYWENLTLGDPLTTPYALRPTVDGPADTVAEDGVVVIQADHPDGITWTRAYLNDILVGEAAGNTLEVSAELLGTDGDTVELYLLAEAASTPLDRPGWPVNPIEPTPGVRGWRWATVTLGPPAPEPVDTGSAHDTADPTPDDTDSAATDTASEPDGSTGSGKSSGCSVAGAAPAGFIVSLALAAVAGRRED